MDIVLNRYHSRIVLYLVKMVLADSRETRRRYANQIKVIMAQEENEIRSRLKEDNIVCFEK